MIGGQLTHMQDHSKKAAERVLKKVLVMQDNVAAMNLEVQRQNDKISMKITD